MYVNYMALGDSAYPLKQCLMTNPANAAERRYNYHHMRTRCIVERAIGVWKSRFRCVCGYFFFIFLQSNLTLTFKVKSNLKLSQMLSQFELVRPITRHPFKLGSQNLDQSAKIAWAKVAVVFNTLRPRQHGRHFADDTLKRIFMNENVIISIKISLKFVPKGPINTIPALVQIMAWCRPGDKPLSEAMMVSLLTHICITRPQWVKGDWP